MLSCCFAKAEGCQMPTKKLCHPRSDTFTQCMLVYSRTPPHIHTDTDKCKQNSIHCLNLNQCQFWHLQRFCFAPFAYFCLAKNRGLRGRLPGSFDTLSAPGIYVCMCASHILHVYVCVCVYFAHKLTYKLILHKAKCWAAVDCQCVAVRIRLVPSPGERTTKCVNGPQIALPCSGVCLENYLSVFGSIKEKSTHSDTQKSFDICKHTYTHTHIVASAIVK